MGRVESWLILTMANLIAGVDDKLYVIWLGIS